MGRAVNLVYHASGFLRQCRRALRKLAWLTHIPDTAQLYVILYMIHKLHIGFYPNFVLVFKIWVLDSCPIGPGLSKIIEWTIILSARLKPEGTVQSCCVILGSITQSKYNFEALREAYLPTLQVFFLLEPLPIPAGFALRKLPFSPTKLDTPIEPTQLRLWQAALFVFIQRGV